MGTTSSISNAVPRLVYRLAVGVAASVRIAHVLAFILLGVNSGVFVHTYAFESSAVAFGLVVALNDVAPEEYARQSSAWNAEN
jgi:hypothetical protein